LITRGKLDILHLAVALLTPDVALGVHSMRKA
jgi:hypothetical protein